jgi:hypothetical protein
MRRLHKRWAPFVVVSLQGRSKLLQPNGLRQTAHTLELPRLESLLPGLKRPRLTKLVHQRHTLPVRCRSLEQTPSGPHKL